MTASILNMEFIEWAKGISGSPFCHAVFCDPPYSLSFMGKDWDSHANYQEWTRQWAESLLPLLYPGALVMCFGGTRTWHRLAAGMEDAGFEMWDTMMWLHGQGFPKGQDVSKLIDKRNGYEREVIGERQDGAHNTESSAYIQAKRQMLGHGGTGMGYLESGGVIKVTKPSDGSAPWSGHKTPALKPAWEPILCFRAPTQGKTYAELATEYGSGCLNIDGTRIGTTRGVPASLSHSKSSNCYGLGTTSGHPRELNPNLGRYPANLVLDEESAAMLDAQAPATGASAPVRGDEPSQTGVNAYSKWGRVPSNPVFDSAGGASRFFYCAKAAKSERNAGLNGSNNHPTVKPISLCKWLATLLLPPAESAPRRLLVPFSGSGSEVIGALLAGWDDIIGIEQDEAYCELAQSRVAHFEDTHLRTQCSEVHKDFS